jgi:DNA-binding response OmpR family regulator
MPISESSVRILVVEDEKPMANALTLKLENQGINAIGQAEG